MIHYRNCENGSGAQSGTCVRTIPTGLCPSTQGCEQRAYLGKTSRQNDNRKAVGSMSRVLCSIPNVFLIHSISCRFNNARRSASQPTGQRHALVASDCEAVASTPTNPRFSPATLGRAHLLR